MKANKMQMATGEFMASLQHKYLVGYDVAEDGTLVVIFFSDDLNHPTDLAQRDFAQALMALGENFKHNPPSFADTNSMRISMAHEQWKQSAQVDLRLRTEKEGREWKGLKTMIGTAPNPLH